MNQKKFGSIPWPSFLKADKELQGTEKVPDADDMTIVEDVMDKPIHAEQDRISMQL